MENDPDPAQHTRTQFSVIRKLNIYCAAIPVHVEPLPYGTCTRKIGQQQLSAYMYM